LAQNVRDTEALLCCEFQNDICKIGGVVEKNVGYMPALSIIALVCQNFDH